MTLTVVSIILFEKIALEFKGSRWPGLLRFPEYIFLFNSAHAIAIFPSTSRYNVTKYEDGLTNDQLDLRKWAEGATP